MAEAGEDEFRDEQVGQSAEVRKENMGRYLVGDGSGSVAKGELNMVVGPKGLAGFGGEVNANGNYLLGRDKQDSGTVVEGLIWAD